WLEMQAHSPSHILGPNTTYYRTGLPSVGGDPVLPDGRQRPVQELVRGSRRGGLLAVRALGRSRTRLPSRWWYRGRWGHRGRCGRVVVAIGYFRTRKLSERDQFFRGSGRRGP